MKKRLIVFLILFGTLTGFRNTLYAQYYKTGEDPARLRWSQVKTGPFQIIYPQGMDSLAFRYAWLLEQVSPPVMSSLGISSPSVPIVLHAYNVKSNGTVAWAPKRIEMITTPPSEGLTQNWEKQLVLHEIRHVGQMHLAGRNFFRFLGLLLGEQSTGLSVGLYFPAWLLEGDAVLTETLFSQSGRGREAAFLMPYKAYFLSGISYPYDKWRFGSFRHYIPNHYALGYMKLSVARYYSGEEALPQIFDDITTYPYWPFIYGRTFRKNYGYYALKLWEPAAEYYKNAWKAQDALKMAFDPGLQLNKSVKDYVSYTSAAVTEQPDGETGLYAIKSSLAQTERLVYFPNEGSQKEKTVTLLGQINSSVNAGRHHLYWSETVSGHRWAHENFSVIMTYNTVTGKKKTLCSGTRYFNPNPSHDGHLVAACHYQPAGSSQLHLLDVNTGEVRESYDIPSGQYPGEVTWSEDDRMLHILLTGDEGTGIYTLERGSGKWDTLLLPSFHSLSDIMEFENVLYFKTDKFLNTDNIYKLNLTDKSVCQLTEVRFGAFDPLVAIKDGKHYLYYSHYTPQGYQLCRLPLEDLLCIPVDISQERQDLPLLSPGTGTTFNIDALRVPEDLEYSVKKYSKLGHAFKIHSWMPFYFNYNRIEHFTFKEYYKTVAAGATLMTQNSLGTLSSLLGYSYRRGFHAGHIAVDYSGWFPVFSLQADINDRVRTQTSLAPPEGTQERKWKTDTLSSVHTDIRLKTYIPFTFHSHGWSRGLVPSVQYRFSNNLYTLPGTQDKHVSNQSLQLGVQYYQMTNLAPRDIFPRLGFGLNVQGLFDPGYLKLFSHVFFMQAYGYVPGVIRNQALKWTVSWQQHALKNRLFYLGTFLQPLRGIKENHHAPATFATSADYAIPIGIGDPSIPDVLYIKRLQLIPFGEYRQFRHPEREKEHAWSCGADLLFDFHIFRIGLPLTAGLRYAYTYEKKHHVEFLFSFPAFN
ncbi:MAG: hypothetical protein GX877_05200 [Bacteroidales bacterium]|nr:hypothetical protein [Bacteroidales bacterium]